MTYSALNGLSSVLDKLIGVIAKEFSLDEDSISAETDAEDIELWDSFGHLALIMSIEREFSARFKADEIMEITSVSRILEALQHQETG